MLSGSGISLRKSNSKKIRNASWQKKPTEDATPHLVKKGTFAYILESHKGIFGKNTYELVLLPCFRIVYGVINTFTEEMKADEVKKNQELLAYLQLAKLYARGKSEQLPFPPACLAPKDLARRQRRPDQGAQSQGVPPPSAANKQSGPSPVTDGQVPPPGGADASRSSGSSKPVTQKGEPVIQKGAPVTQKIQKGDGKGKGETASGASTGLWAKVEKWLPSCLQDKPYAKYVVVGVIVLLLAVPIALCPGVLESITNLFTGKKSGKGNLGPDGKELPKTFAAKAKAFWNHGFYNLDSTTKVGVGAVALAACYGGYNKCTGKTILGKTITRDVDPTGTPEGDDGQEKSFWHQHGGWLVPLAICLIGVAVVVFYQMGGDPAFESDGEYYDGDLEAGGGDMGGYPGGDAGW